MSAIPSEESEVKLHMTMDANIWAREFVRINPIADLDMARAWFANAIMCGHDHANWKVKESLDERYSQGFVDGIRKAAEVALEHIETKHDDYCAVADLILALLPKLSDSKTTKGSNGKKEGKI